MYHIIFAFHCVFLGYRQVSNIRRTLLAILHCWSLRCSWSIACRRCSNYIFILNLTPGFNRLGKDNYKIRREAYKFWDLVRLILETLRYVFWNWQIIYGFVKDSLLFQSAMAHLLIMVWLQWRVTIAKNQVTNTTIWIEKEGAFVTISFTLDFIDGVSDGWTVIMTTNPKLESIDVCMTGVYMYFILSTDIRIYL